MQEPSTLSIDTRSADEKFKEFKRNYIGDLHERIAFFEETLSTLSLGSLPHERFDEIKHFAHTLAGTGGIFGFFAITNSARSLTECMVLHPENATLLQERIQNVIEACRDAIAKAGR